MTSGCSSTCLTREQANSLFANHWPRRDTVHAITAERPLQEASGTHQVHSGGQHDKHDGYIATHVGLSDALLAHGETDTDTWSRSRAPWAALSCDFRATGMTPSPIPQLPYSRRVQAAHPAHCRSDPVMTFPRLKKEGGPQPWAEGNG